MRAALEAQATALNAPGAVTFHGALPHREVQDVAAQANLLTFPSIREFGGGVVLEAMTLGVVPVIVDYAGPGELVTDQTGYKIPIGDRADIITRLRGTLDDIVADPSALPARAEAARATVAAEYTWAAKAAKIAEIYADVLQEPQT